MLLFQDFTGNENNDGSRKITLEEPFMATYVRVRVTEWHNKISMRLELYGCKVRKYTVNCLPCKYRNNLVHSMGRQSNIEICWFTRWFTTPRHMHSSIAHLGNIHPKSTEQEQCPEEDAMSGIMYLPNDQITASGFQEGYEPWQGRLNAPSGWIADEPYSDTAYIQARFNRYDIVNHYPIFTEIHF